MKSEHLIAISVEHLMVCKQEKQSDKICAGHRINKIANLAENTKNILRCPIENVALTFNCFFIDLFNVV